MIFAEMPLPDAEGAFSAHSVRWNEVSVKKGQKLSRADLEALASVGYTTIVAFRLEEGDIGEDEAAHGLARALAGEGVRVDRPFTGRANLFAEHDGIFVVPTATIDAVNGVDEAITVATLPAFKPVVAGEMIGTVKIIPYAVPGALQAQAVAAARERLRVAPYTVKRVAVISTLLPGLKPSVVRKTLDVLRRRLEPSGAALAGEAEVPHETEPLAEALGWIARQQIDLAIVFGASAIADRRDVIPAAIEQAGGCVLHFGMPVDPGNLLLIGEIDGMKVLGAPGCARSPKENGFDWVLARLLAGLPVERADIVALGVGGLLMEIVSRPQPRGDPAAKGEAENDEPEA